MSSRGFTLIELLIAAAVVITISGALAAMVRPLGSVIDRAHFSADMEAGTRAAIQQLAADLRLAGSDAGVAPPSARLSRVVPPVALLRDLAGGEVGLPATAMRITFIPHLAAQGTLDLAAGVGDTLLHLDTTTRCALGFPSCGFRPGQHALLYSNAAASVVTIDATANGVVTLGSPLSGSFPAGAVLAEFVAVTYGTRPRPDGSHQLVRISTGGAEQPVLDHVVAFTVTTDTGDPLDAGRVSWRLRVQAPSTAFRGPAGSLFHQAGTATHSRDLIPDLEHRMAVALRNRGGL